MAAILGETCCDCGAPMAPGAHRCEACGAPAPSPTAVRAIVPSPTATPVTVGEVLEGKWRLEGKLGVGGAGAVFLARDVALDRKVAVKVLAAQLCGDAELVTRFEREARATARLEHPNIVPIYGVGRHHGRPFIVMKALEGVTLAQAIRARLVDGRRFARDELLSIFRQLCDGLGFVHGRGYVHRDVKAGNVFLGEDGRVTLLDFGVLHDASASRITRSGVMLGTPHYVAPEQALGLREVDARADLYAVGVLLYECLTLQPPFTGDPVTLMQAHAQTPPPDPRALAPELPAAMTRVVHKALAKRPADRCSTAAELWAELEAAWPASASALPADLLKTLPAAPPKGAKPAARKPARPATPARSLTRTGRERSRGRADRWLLFGAGAALAFGIGLLAAWLMLGR